MIIQPKMGTRNVNNLFYEEERKRVEMLNNEFFHDIELTDSENKILIWLCGFDNWTIEIVMSVFMKVRGINT